MTKSKNHLISIDVLRGLAALAVMLYHFSGGFLSSNNWLTVANQYGYLGVDAFYVISGLVIPLSFSVKNYQVVQFWSFFKKRFVRIEPAYWASIVLIIFKETTSSLVQDYRYFKMPNYTFEGIGGHFLHINDFFDLPWLQAVYWTLAIDWQFFIFVGLVFFWFNRPEWWARYPLYVVLIGSRWWFEVSEKEWLFYHVLLFAPGVVLFHFQKKYISRWECYGILLAVFYGILLKMGWSHLIATVLSVAVIEIFTGQWRVLTWLTEKLAALGKISYSVYLTHIFSGWWVTSVLMNVAKTEGAKTISVGIGIVVSIYFAQIFYNAVEKPTQDWARRV